MRVPARVRGGPAGGYSGDVLAIVGYLVAASVAIGAALWVAGPRLVSVFGIA